MLSAALVWASGFVRVGLGDKHAAPDDEACYKLRREASRACSSYLCPLAPKRASDRFLSIVVSFFWLLSYILDTMT